MPYVVLLCSARSSGIGAPGRTNCSPADDTAGGGSKGDREGDVSTDERCGQAGAAATGAGRTAPALAVEQAESEATERNEAEDERRPEAEEVIFLLSAFLSFPLCFPWSAHAEDEDPSYRDRRRAHDAVSDGEGCT